MSLFDYRSVDIASSFRRDFDKSVDRWGFSPSEFRGIPLVTLWDWKLRDDTVVTIQNVTLSGGYWKGLSQNVRMLKELSNSAVSTLSDVNGHSGPPDRPINGDKADIGISGCSPFSVVGGLFNAAKYFIAFGASMVLGLVLLKLLLAYVAAHGAHMATNAGMSLIRSFLNKENMRTAILKAVGAGVLGDLVGHFFHDFIPWLADAVGGDSDSTSHSNHSHHTSDGQPTFGEGNGGLNGCYQCACPKFIDDGVGNCVSCKAFGYYNHTYYNHAG